MMLKAYAESISGATGNSDTKAINGALKAGVNNTGRVLNMSLGGKTYSYQPGDTIYNSKSAKSNGATFSFQRSGAVQSPVRSLGKNPRRGVERPRGHYGGNIFNPNNRRPTR